MPDAFMHNWANPQKIENKLGEVCQVIDIMNSLYLKNNRKSKLHPIPGGTDKNSTCM